MILIAGAMFMVIMAAQGAVVFATAWLALHLLKRRHPVAKGVAMAVSWFAWVVATQVAYFAVGGSGGLMQGFGLVLVLCALAAVSSFFYFLAWALWPRVFKPRTNASAVF